MPHDFDSGPIHERTLRVESIEWRPSSQSHAQGLRSSNNSWTRICQEQACKSCGLRRIVDGSSVFNGTGIYSYLDNLQDDPRFHPDGLSRDPQSNERWRTFGYFRYVPPPPPGWMPSHFSAAELTQTKREFTAAMCKMAKANGLMHDFLATDLSKSQEYIIRGDESFYE